MASLNRVVLVGNLTRDPDLRSTPSGSSVVSFGLAVNRRWTNRQGERVDGVDYLNIVAWGKLAELCHNYIHKGSPVALEGRLQSRSWETEDGQKRSAVEVVAENVQFLERQTTREAAPLADKDFDREPTIPSESSSEMNLKDDIPF